MGLRAARCSEQSCNIIFFLNLRELKTSPSASLFTRGPVLVFSCLMYGDQAFEMTRTYGGKSFCLREHIVRLYNSLKMMKIDPGMTMDEMEVI